MRHRADHSLLRRVILPSALLSLFAIAGVLQAEPGPSPRPSPSLSPKPSNRPVPAPAAKPTAKRAKPVAKPAPRVKPLPPLLKEVEEKYSRSETVVAQFAQVNDSAALKTQSKSQGTLMIKRPDKFRMEQKQPSSNLLVTDGRTYWFYTPPFDEEEPGQLIERKSSDLLPRLARTLLTGKFSGNKGMQIKASSGAGRFVLIPRPGSAGSVLRAEIEVDPSAKLIQKVVLDHKGGNHSEIVLSQIELGKPLGEDLFKFVAPPNTERVHE